MAKNQPKIIPPGQPQKIPTLNAQQILQNAQNLKNRFSQQRGQSIQWDADASSDFANGMLQMISQILQVNQQQEARIKELESRKAPPDTK